MRAGQTAKAAEVYRAVTRLPEAEQSLLDAANARLGEIQGTQAATQGTPATP